MIDPETPSPISYSYTIETTNESYTVSGFPSPSEARKAVVRGAVLAGWRPRRWWELWKPACSISVRLEYERQTKGD